jgi:polar amino acid transport system substrate-binding protein
MTNINFKMIFFLFIILLSTNIYAKQKHINLVTDSWVPYYGPNIKNNGYFAHLVKEAFKRKGYSLTVHFRPWKRALLTAKSGKFDGILGAFYKKNREEFFEYSESIDKSKIVLFAKKDSTIKYNNLNDLTPYVIGVVRGYHYSDDFSNFKSKLKVYESTDTNHNIKLLLYNRLDLVLGSKNVILDLIEKNYKNDITKFKILKTPLISNDLYVPISKKNKNHKQIISDFNQGLAEIKKDGTYDQILKLYNF